MKRLLLLEYPPCSTCRRARSWLTERGVPFISRPIQEQPPTADELRDWLSRGGVPLKRLFNTSGQSYRQLHLKERLPGMGEAEQIALLSDDGMLVKRPLLIVEETPEGGKGLTVLAGFRPAEWEEALR